MAKKDKKSGEKKGGAKKAARKKKAESGIDEGALSSALVVAARAHRTLMTRALAAAGLFAGQETVIMALADAGETGATPGAVADALGVRAPTMTKTINRLAAQGFVDKRASTSDQRMTELRLTAKGNDAVASIRTAIIESEHLMLADFSAKEAKALVKLLRRVETNLTAAVPA